MKQRRRSIWFVGLLVTAAASCAQAGIRGDLGSGGAGGGGAGAGAGGPSGAGGANTGVDAPVASSCVGAPSAGIYLLDQTGDLLRFDPATLTFTLLGALKCPAVAPGDYNSMAVDRSGVAWINALDSGGGSQLFKLPIQSLLCTGTTFIPSEVGKFGMGFSSNQPGSSEETLFLDGQLGFAFGSVAFPTLAFHRAGQTQGSLEFTGTGDAELWGFRPQAPAAIGQIDKTNGSFIKSYPAPQIRTDLGQVSYAFAFWGDVFWLFLKGGDQTSTSVYRIARGNGDSKMVVADSGRVIVGAGVSTCAPVQDIP